MAVVFDLGAGGGNDVIIIVNSTSGSTADTGVTGGNYSGRSAAIVEAHKTVTKAGPIFVDYDPEWAALLAMEF